MAYTDMLKRAEELSHKTTAGSITPEVVGNLLRDIISYVAEVEREGGTLGVRKVYPTVAAMQADTSPQLEGGRPLRSGNLVAIYDSEHTDATDNGRIYVYTGEGWTEIAHLKVRLANAYTDEDKAKVDRLQTDGKGNEYLAADGTYKEINIPKAPIQSISVGGVEVAPSPEGRVDLTIPKAPVQGVSVNGKPVAPTAEGIVDIETGKGNVRSIKVNGVRHEANEAGEVTITIDTVEVDETLSKDSTNAVANSAVTAKLEELDKASVAGMDAQLSEDKAQVRLKLTNKQGEEVASVDLPAGGGGGGGETQTTRLLLSASVDQPDVKVGDSATLTYTYRHVSADSDETPTGVQATIRLIIRRGATQLLEQTIPDVSAGTYTLDLTPYLKTAGTIDVQVFASATNAEGQVQKRTAATKVDVYALTLASSYSVSSGLVGYSPSSILSIPYTVTGVGSKTITCYIDGESHSVQTVTRAGVTNGTIQVPLSGMSEGRHTAQLVAELTIGAKEIRSESIYIDYYIGRTEDLPRIGVMFRRRDGRIHSQGEHLHPKVDADQFESYSFDYAIYDPQRQPAELTLKVGSAEPLSLSLGRGTETYTSRSITSGDLPVHLSSRLGVSYDLTIEVRAGRVSVGEITDGLTLALSALGRSNAEANPATWMSGGISTIFHKFDWSAGGWDGSALKLINGSSITIPATFFASDPMGSGGTIEIELRTDNVLSDSGAVVSCRDEAGVGFTLTGKHLELRTSSGALVTQHYAPGEYLRMAIVIQPKSAHRLLELYVNGIRSGAVSYGQADSLLQAAAKPIEVTSDHADVSLRAVRLYTRALSDDELLSNYIASRPDASEVVNLYERNDVLGDDGAVSLDKLRRQGKSVLRIVGNVPLVNETNTKKFEVPVDIYFYSGFGKQYDFVCKGAGLRIQGTSSTTYPRKNYRIYLDRKKKYNTTLTVGGIEQATLKYAFTPGAVPVSVFTLKADFAESSSTHNTGLAKLIDETFRRAGILTPPQKKSDGVRIAIDGFPMDAFFDLDGSGKNTYLGKYNFNNDKSGSEEVFGFVNDDKCLCLEFLNNSEPLALFATDNMANFKTALEFRHPDGAKWDTANEAHKTAVRRLWKWVASCKDNATKFKREVADYFDIDSLTGWYIMTDYFMMVDQRAKNMMLATWDGVHWYFLPYDNDTVLGERNDGVLIYLYTIDETTYDITIGSYAFAGHDSVLWQLVREALPDKLAETAQKIRATMSKERVLEILNGMFMRNWSERVYNKDGEYKYLKPYIESGIDYLYCLQGSRYAHRTAMINDRFALLDSKYLAGTYRADALRLYFAHNFSKDRKLIGITASERYYFGYGYTSKAPHVSGVRADAAGDKVSLELDIDLIVNDPQNIYGASRMAELDLSQVSPYIIGTSNFDKCPRLSKLNLACPAGQTTLTAVTVSACRVLEELNVSGLRSPSFRSLDLSGNPRLRKLDASGTVLTNIVFADGAPVTEVRLPDTLTTLRLRHLPLLTSEGLIGLHADTITRLWWEDCPKMDWEALLETLPSVTHLRIVGIDREGDVTWLNRYLAKGGISSSGSLTTTCALVGTYRLTQYLGEEEYARLSAHFPELSIRQPEYTVVGYYNRWRSKEGLPLELTVMDKWFNLDNGTGYGTDKPYKPSGHITRISRMRHRWRGIEERRGEMVVYPLHDEHSGYYADNTDVKLCTPSNLGDAAEGGIWVNEPHYWYKGIHDGETGTDYQVYSANLERPRTPEGRLISYQEILSELKPMLQHYVRCPKGTKTDKSVSVDSLLYKHLAAYTNSNNCNLYSCIKIPVSGYKRVRFPLCNNGYTDTDDPSVGVTSPGERQPAPYGDRYLFERGCMISAVFTDGDGKVMRVLRLSNKDYPIMYRDYVASVPEGAVYLYTSVLTELIDEEMDIWLTNSSNPADWEPHWQEHQEAWIAATPLHWQTGEPLPSMRLAEGLTIGRKDEDRWIFYVRHGHYDNVSYEDVKDIRNLLYAETGTFDLKGIFGRTPYRPDNTNYTLWSLPEAGMRGTTALTTEGRRDPVLTPGVITDDGLGTVRRKTCNLPSALGYTWVLTGVSTPLSALHRDETILSATKDRGIGLSRSLRRDNTNFSNHYYGDKFLFIQEYRNGSVTDKSKPRRILCRMSFYDSNNYTRDIIREMLGGRYLDIMARRDHPSWIAGLSTELSHTLIYTVGDTHSMIFNNPSDGSFHYQAELSYDVNPLASYAMIPVFRGRVIRASSVAELRSHKQYKFLIDEKADFTQW